MPFGPSSLMCLRLFMCALDAGKPVEQGNLGMLTNGSKELTSLDSLRGRRLRHL